MKRVVIVGLFLVAWVALGFAVTAGQQTTAADVDAQPAPAGKAAAAQEDDAGGCCAGKKSEQQKDACAHEDDGCQH